MEKFIDLGISVFDEGFTLDPYPYLKDLYGRDDILGFHSEGMNFLFRFEQVREVIRSRHCRREPLASAEIEAREKVYAERYPNRAKHFALAYPMAAPGGGPEFVTKKLLMDFLDRTALTADFSGSRPIYERLARGGRVDDYIESVQTLPLRVMLETCGLPFTEAQLAELNLAGIHFIKALDNFVDETPLGPADAAVECVWRYLDENLEAADPESPIRRLVDDGRKLGLDDEKIKVNIAAMVIISLANTAGLSSAYVLRTLLRYPEVRRELGKNPQLVRDDDVIIELLRRDNHVKALSRQVHDDFQLGPFPMQRGESLFLLFPGANLDPVQYPEPLRIDLDRRFSGANQVVFGGSAYICIGRKLGIEFLKNMVGGFVEHLPESAQVVEAEVEADGDWVAERIITKMPIVLEG